MRAATVDDTSPWDAIEAERDTPRELSDADWELLEALAAAGGPNGDGDLRRWGQPSTARLLELLEVPGPRLMHCINLLLLARRDDVIEALAEADYSGELLPEIIMRADALHAERERLEAHLSRPKRTRQLQARPSLQEQSDATWAACLADPAAALQRVAEIKVASKSRQSAEQRSATALGIRYQADSEKLLTAEQTRQAIAERLQLLEDALQPVATGPTVTTAAVVITPMPEPAPAAVETWELGPYPPLTAEMLLAEAWAHQPDRCTLQDRLAAWEAQDGQDLDWRVFFGALSDFAWPSAAAAISGATGIPTAEVQAWEATVRQRHQEDLAELRTAYSDLSELLADAVQQRGWQWLSAGLAIRCDSLMARARELSDDPRPSATEALGRMGQTHCSD